MLGNIINDQGTEVSVLSVACQTGFRQFSQPLSKCHCIREVIAPHSSVPGAVASQFLQTYFAERMLEGRTEKSTFRHARERVPGATNFRRWKDGGLNQ